MKNIFQFPNGFSHGLTLSSQDILITYFQFPNGFSLLKYVRKTIVSSNNNFQFPNGFSLRSDTKEAKVI